MTIRLTEYNESVLPELLRFNERLRAGNVDITFPETPPLVPSGLLGQRRRDQHILAVEDGSIVRGAYILKHQDFWIGGSEVSVADFTLPISEGTVDRSYAPLGALLLRDAHCRQPLLFGMGMGGFGESVARLLVAAGWKTWAIPFFFRVLRPVCFLKNIAYLRRHPLRRWLLDALALSGLGSLAIHTAQRLHHRGAQAEEYTAEVVDEFGPWADDVWEAAKADYEAVAVRDAAALRFLYPQADPRFIRLKVQRGGRCIGWALLLDSQLAGHKYFSNMRLGSLADCFASVADARAVVVAARDFLERRGVDLIVSNQAHLAWRRALRTSGFLAGLSNFLFASSPELTEMLKSAKATGGAIHLNRGDGDGPINL